MTLVVLCFPRDGLSFPLQVLIVVGSILLACYAVNGAGLHSAVGNFYEVLLIARTLNSNTAGLPISWTVGLLNNFCCRGPILIPRPDSETSTQITRGNVLDFFVKPKNGISASHTKRR